MTTIQHGPQPVQVIEGGSILDNIISQTLLSADDEAYGIAKRGVSAFIAELVKPHNCDEPVKKTPGRPDDRRDRYQAQRANG